jgi:hypothetical protein
MNREEIIRMAREAGLYVGRNISGVQLVGSSYEEGGLLVHLAVEELERFAALVAANEREACAKVVEQIFDDLAKDNFVDSTAVANLICNFGDFVGKPLIEAIRARGEQ